LQLPEAKIHAAGFVVAHCSVTERVFPSLDEIFPGRHRADALRALDLAAPHLNAISNKEDLARDAVSIHADVLGDNQGAKSGRA
jgi:hypothetical protein